MTDIHHQAAANVDENEMLDTKTSSYVTAYAITALFNGLLVPIKEKIPFILDAMKALGHHWVTQGILDVIVFFAVAMWLSGKDRQISAAKGVNYLIWSTVVGGLLVAGFYLIGII